MKIELGGGIRSRGDGFVSYDIDESVADVFCDLREGIPLDDDTVDELYSSHFLEHMVEPYWFLDKEVCRVCKLGAKVEIRVPHTLSDGAMVWDHKHVFSEMQVYNMDIPFPDEFWTPPKRLKHVKTIYNPCGPFFDGAKKIWTELTDEQIMRFIPRTCHECQFHFKVIPT